MKRAFGIIGALALWACAAPAPEPQAAAAQPADPYRVTVEREAGDVIKVSANIRGKDQLNALHCAAGRDAMAQGAELVEWVGGVAKHSETENSASLVYQAFGPGAAQPRAGAITAEDGGAMPVANWLAYCDKADAPQKGEA